jgi:hypothetical protein
METHEDRMAKIGAKKRQGQIKRLEKKAREAESCMNSARIRSNYEFWQRRFNDLNAELTALRTEEE